MERLNLIKILEHAPQGLKLYCTSIHDTVELNYIFPSYMMEPIQCLQCPGTINIPFTFNEYGHQGLSTECCLYPAEGVSWNNWQDVLFPQSVGSYIINRKNGSKYKILGEGFIEPIDFPNTCIPLNRFDLKSFEYTTLTEKEKGKKPIPMVVKDEKYNEFGLKEFDPVLVKNRSMNTNDCRNVWTPAVFGCIIKMPMGIMYQANSLLWEDCIPYTKQTAHLIGTDQTFDKNLIKKKRSKKKNSK